MDIYIFYNFIYFWLLYRLSFSHCSEQGLLSRCGAQASHCSSFSWAARAQSLQHTGLVAPWHVGSSWIRDGTCVSCMGKQILYHWAISKVPGGYFWVLLYTMLFWRSRANSLAHCMSVNKGHLFHKLHIVRIPSPSCDISNYEETVGKSYRVHRWTFARHLWVISYLRHSF